MIEPRDGESRGAYRKRRWREQSRTVDAEGNVKSVTEVVRGRKPEKAPPVGIPLATSTLYDKEGRVSAQWVKSGPERRDPEHIARVLADELAKPLPRVAPIAFQAYNGQIAEHLMAVYPVGDHHLGMLSWRAETGASYDLAIGEKLLADAFNHLIPLTPKCARAAIIFLGDFLHHDSPDPVTPQSKHQLDADSRWQLTVRAAMRSMRRQIEALALWHQSVEVIVEPGNHDPYSSVFLAEALRNIYEDNKRIVIDTSPKPFHMIRFGKVMIATHHGDLVKPEGLAGVMSCDWPRDWGETEYRYCYTGHVHSHNARDFRGMAWESFRILPPADAWAFRAGYRSIRDQKAIIHHADFGEVARHTVNPAMLEKA